MSISGHTLFAFVDLKDPFMPGEILGEEQPGPVLSLMGARRFDFLFLFHTPHTYHNAAATRDEAMRRHPDCRIILYALNIPDPKDYSALMRLLTRQVQEILWPECEPQPPGTSEQMFSATEHNACVSSGTAEMRAAWFLLKASGVLRANLLQVSPPAEPLFGAANVKEVRLDIDDLTLLRDFGAPKYYIPPRAPGRRFQLGWRAKPERTIALERLEAAAAAPEPEAPPVLPSFEELEEALQELGIFIGSATLRAAAERSAIAAECDLPVLLLGETGTGKELFAKLIHRLSGRRGRPLVPVNCAAIPKELVESSLFGHAKGAFTGAMSDQRGKFQQADGSTLFLDEIGELTLEAQAKLLRVLQDGEVEPLGSNRSCKVDVRIVAATNRNLREETEAGRFREDLYYRLEVLHIQLPPLRERRAEIASLTTALLKRINQRRQRARRLSKEALRRLEQHHWPGNVRELSNVLERSVLYSRSDVLDPDDLLIVEKAPGADPLAMLPEPEQGFSIEEFLAQARKQLFLRALEKSNGNQSAAAMLLGVSKQAVNKFVSGETGNGD